MIWDANVRGDSKLFECSALPASLISCEQGLGSVFASSHGKLIGRGSLVIGSEMRRRGAEIE